jgi:hypothetical protein
VINLQQNIHDSKALTVKASCELKHRLRLCSRELAREDNNLCISSDAAGGQSEVCVMDEKDDMDDEELVLDDENLNDEDDQSFSLSGDDPVAEGEVPAAPKPKPSEASKNSAHERCSHWKG